MSHYAVYEEGVGRIQTQGGPQADGTKTTEGSGRRLGVTTSGECDGGIRIEGDGYLRLHPS